MVGIATACLLNVRDGVRASYYGLGLLFTLLGGFVALRQIALHVCPGFSQFGIPVLGLSLYTWSFVVFVCCLAAIALLLFLYKPEPQQESLPQTHWNLFALGFLLLIKAANILSTYLQCGFGPCVDV